MFQPWLHPSLRVWILLEQPFQVEHLSSWGRHSQDRAAEGLGLGPGFAANLLWDPGKSLPLLGPQFSHLQKQRVGLSGAHMAHPRRRWYKEGGTWTEMPT